jgi:NADPH-dependent F420 reductase
METSTTSHPENQPAKAPAETTVAVVGGTGSLGQGLTTRFAKSGIPLIIGSRSLGAATEAAEILSDSFPEASVAALENPEAVERADVVFLSVPFAHQAATLGSIRDSLRPGQVVVDAVVPLATAVGGRPTRTLGVAQGSAAEQARELIPDEVGVVSALHTVSAAALADHAEPLEEDVLVCGDVKGDKLRVIELLECIPGIRGVDCGRLESARIVEPLTALLIGINGRYKTHAGIRITGLPATRP